MKSTKRSHLSRLHICFEYRKQFLWPRNGRDIAVIFTSGPNDLPPSYRYLKKADLLQTLPFCIRPFLPIFSSISTNFGAEYQSSSTKTPHLSGASSSFHQGKRVKSNAGAIEILAFTPMLASAISKNSRAIFESP